MLSTFTLTCKAITLKYLQSGNIKLEVQVFNKDFVLLTNKEERSLCDLGHQIRSKKFDFINDVIATENEIYLDINDNYSVGKLKKIEQIQFTAINTTKSIQVPFILNPENSLLESLRNKKLTLQDFLGHITTQNISIAMFGFIPGFVYMRELDKKYHIARKNKPSISIPCHSLAVGGKYLGIYSNPSPGGWHIIGQLVFPVYDESKSEPFFISSSDTIKLIPVDKKSGNELKEKFDNLHDYNARA